MEDGIKISELTEASTITGTDIVPIVNDTETKSATINQIANYTNSLLPTPTWGVATITTTPTISSNYFVPLNLMAYSVGNLTIQDGGIRIGANINHIRVSGNVFVDNWAGGSNYLWTMIYRVRGTTESIISGNINGSTSGYISGPIPLSIVAVQEGDIIKLMADSGSGGTIRSYTANTWLMVEKID